MAHILVIDDEVMLGQRLRALLSDQGYKVTVATGGGEGIAALSSQEPPDVVLTDLVMMPPDGYAVMQHIRGQELDLPIIVMTAHSSMESAIKALRLGAYDYIHKPFDIELLYAAVERAVERQHLQEASRRKEQLEALIALADSAAHELNQPLTVILGWLQLLEQDGIPSLTPETVEELTQSAREVAGIVEKMGRIVRYETKPYVGDSLILDLERSSEISAGQGRVV